MKELRSLAALDLSEPAINTSAFPKTDPLSSFWSSSSGEDASYNASAVNFEYGDVSDYFRISKFNVRLVRSIR